MPQVTDFKRRSPKQERSERTIATIFEAVAQILQRDGEAHLTTNAIAERAGVSIGTLYQYFPNKGALLMAIAEAEQARITAKIMKGLEGPPGASIEDALRQTIRLLINSFSGRPRAFKYVMLSVARADQIKLAQIAADGVASALVKATQRYPRDGVEPLTDVQAFVLTRSVMAVIRAAVLEESRWLKTPEFEDEMVRLTVGYLRNRNSSALDQ